MAQLEEALAVNHAVGRSNPGCAKLTKSVQQALNPVAGSFGSRPKLGGPVYHVCTVKIHLCPSHIGQVLRGGRARPSCQQPGRVNC